MDLIKDFRKKDYVISLKKLIEKSVKEPMNIMEICGGHTHSIMKYGLNELLPKQIRFIHGPGCPVCVMGRAKIDVAIKLASMENSVFCTLADLLRVPGSFKSLLACRSEGADVKALYSPLELLKIAKEKKDKNIIFFAIGFETTTPMSAVLIEKVLQMGLKNVFFHINHVNVPAPIHALMKDKDSKIDAFLGPSHVSVIIGERAYEEIVNTYKTPLAISGFEPADIMQSVLNLVLQKNQNQYKLYNEYKRAVSFEGNIKAQKLMDRYFKPCDFDFRGLGLVKDGGYALKDEYAFLDASKCFDCEVESKEEAKACKCAQILKGKALPNECSLFAKACTPQSPVGACMVSSEGACAAYFKYKKDLI